jgi:dTDP-glucose 4,6-dehydratase
MKRILVTGGAGFIGSHFIRHALNHGEDYQVVNLDCLTYAGNLDNLEDLSGNSRYSFVQGDISNSTLVNSIFEEGVDLVVNFAAESHVDRSISDPGVFIRTNVVGTHVLLEAARAHGIEKFMQISTDEVYGSLGPTGYFTETSPLRPSSPYSASKTGADHLVLASYRTYGLPVNITRCSNNYGPYQYPEKLIPLMIANALDDKPLPVYGDGTNVRDWIHVREHCEAIMMVLRYGRVGEVYNVGGNQEVQNIDIVKRILDSLGKSYSLIEYVTDRLGHDRRYAIDSTKIQNELMWKPQIKMEQGLIDTIGWYLDNEAWWRPSLSKNNQNGASNMPDDLISAK